MSDLFFAYGTLRRGFSRHILLRRLGVKFTGQGTIQADLHDLGEFPGALHGNTRLVGEIYRLPDPVKCLKVLDRVEGCSSVSLDASIFRRDLVEATRENHTVVQAWVYWLNRWPGPRRRITSGDYAKYHDE